MSVFVDSENTWRYEVGDTTARNYVRAAIGDIVRCAFDFSTPAPDDVALASVTSVTIANIAGTEPTLGTPALSYDRRKVEVDITCTSATANTYTLTATAVTTDSQTLVRKGYLIIA